MRGTTMDFPLTLHHIFEHATTLFPGQEIVTGGALGTHRYTYRDFGGRVRRLASALVAAGVQPGDRVASFAWNHYRHLELYFAVPLIGAVLHTVNIRLFHDQISYIANHAADRWLFVDRSLLPVLQPILPTLKTVETLVCMDDGADVDLGQAIDYEALLAGETEELVFPRVDETEAAVLCYTSGTTGHPKGVAYSHRALTLHSFAACMPDAMGIAQRDTVMAIVPMFHVNAWGLPYSCALVGAKQVLTGSAPQPPTLLGLLEQEGVTLAAGVPTIFIGLQPALASGKLDLSKLKRVLIGGAAVPPSLIEAYDRLGIQVIHAWGMTETAPLATMGRLKKHLETLPADERLAYRAKQGLPAGGAEIKALDDDGREVPWDGQAMGELVIRGPWITGSYYQDPRSAEAFTPDGWFRTGDVATIDPEGYIQIVDRTKDLVKSGGEWISSLALENALMAHPKVLEAAVIAVPDARWTERPLACVVPRPESKGELTEAELAAHLAPRFARWWLPEHYVFLDELPKTSVGKFDKKVLRRRFGEGTPG